MMTEYTPEQRIALWQAGILDTLDNAANNKNPNQYEEAVNLDLVPYGDTKIGPSHPYYEEAKKYWEAFNDAKSKFLVEVIPKGPSTDAEFRDFDLRLKELQAKLAPAFDEYMSEDQRDDLEEISSKCSLMHLFDIVQTTMGHDGDDWLVIGNYIGDDLSSDHLKDIARKESLDETLAQYSPFKHFLDTLLKAEDYDSLIVTEFTQSYLGCKRLFMTEYYKRFGLDTPIENVYDFYTENIHDVPSVERESEQQWERWRKQFFDAREGRAAWVATLFNAYTDISLTEGDQKMIQEDLEEEEFHENADFGYVYLIRNQELVKIGITGNLLRRMSQLEPDEILNVVRCKNYRELEKDLHRLFTDERIPQTEYFRLSEEQINKVHKLMTSLADF